MDKRERERLLRRAQDSLQESIRVKDALHQTVWEPLLEMTELIVQAFRGKHRLFLFGNGGSAADAQHLAAEFVNRFQRERPPLPAIALTVDASILTSVANDFSFEDVFIRQLRALAQEGDVALGLSTSGTSPNVIKALRWAREHGLHTLGWCGAAQTEMDVYSDRVIHVPSHVTARIQECHITVGHILCELVEEMILNEEEPKDCTPDTPCVSIPFLSSNPTPSSYPEPLSFESLQTVSLKDRPSKVSLEDFGKPWQPGESLARFVAGLPGLLGAEQFRQAVKAIADTVGRDGTVLLGMGAHPIKVGLNPVLVDALNRRIFKGLALNGAGVIHDVELALAGKTSEDVAAHLDQGQFGTARETAEFIHAAVALGYKQGNMGLGRAVGEQLLRENAPYAELSLLATAAKQEIPVTVHVALGTDIIHMHPAMDGAAMGALSHYDFRLFCRLVTTLKEGVFINLGSAVILPEVFLKAVSVARNLGYPLEGLTTVNMDFQRHYRPQVNVVQRPTAGTGRGIYLIGHHEIMFPLLMAAVLEGVKSEE